MSVDGKYRDAIEELADAISDVEETLARDVDTGPRKRVRVSLDSKLDLALRIVDKAVRLVVIEAGDDDERTRRLLSEASVPIRVAAAGKLVTLLDQIHGAREDEAERALDAASRMREFVRQVRGGAR